MPIQTLVMGFGGSGAHILTYLKESAVYKYAGAPPNIRFRLFDTIADWQPGKTVALAGGAGEETIAAGRERGTSLDPNAEYFHLRDRAPELRTHVFDLMSPAGSPERYPHLKDWLHTAWLSKQIPANSLNIVQGAAQQRQIGRFAMFQNVQYIVAEIDRILQELRRDADGADVNVWIVGSSAGGTGAGSLCDAAFMTHLAAQRANMTPRILGLVVLPEVFSDKTGVSPARAYSLFRELERFQENDIPERDRYVSAAGTASSEVMYDARGSMRTVTPGRLFDFLVYAGRRSTTDRQRIAFFSSVANAVDAYVDEQLGAGMMDKLVNTPGRPFSFGAARLYMPLTTYAELFAWEQVREYLRGVGTPREEGGQVTSIYAGPSGDRHNHAQSRVESMLSLFQEVLKLDNKSRNEQAGFVRENLDAQTIVTRWYQFGATQFARMDVTPAEMETMVPLAYVNPYISLHVTDDTDVPPGDRRVKTYQENRQARGVAESQEDSRDRFARELADITQAYTDAGAGQGTFEAGRRLIRTKMTTALRQAIDTMMEDEFRRTPQVAPEGQRDENGTVLTRLYEELKWSDDRDGPIAKIDRIIAGFVETLNAEEGSRRRQVVEAVSNLKERRPRGFDRLTLTTWVESPQQLARDECASYVRWYQKRELLTDMQELVRTVRARFVQWLDHVEEVLKILVLQREESRPAYYSAMTDHIRVLESRLGRMAQDESVLISLEPHEVHDITMQGYHDRLRRKAISIDNGTLATRTLQQSQWQASVTNGVPLLTLQSPLGAVEQQHLKSLPERLAAHYRTIIDNQLRDEDIFDYLQYAQREHGMNLKEVATRLYQAGGLLITTRERGTCAWVYRRAQDINKQNLAAALHKELTEISEDEVIDAFQNHSDRFSLSLLKVCEPNPDDIIDIDRCKADYLKMLTDGLTGDGEHDDDVWRALVYHPFRAELEAWYIERRYANQVARRNLEATDLMPPRIVRLLEKPEMMRAFVHCIATGAVEKDAHGTWLWHDSKNSRDVLLTDADREGASDLVRAAVIFTLQQREGRRGGLIAITAEDALRSAVAAAQKAERTKDDMVVEFVRDGPLDTYLDQHFPTPESALGNTLSADRHHREKHALRMIFQFYGERTTRTDLPNRMELP